MNLIHEQAQDLKRIQAKRESMVGKVVHVGTPWGYIPGIVIGHGNSYEAAVAVLCKGEELSYLVFSVPWEGFISTHLPNKEKNENLPNL